LNQDRSRGEDRGFEEWWRRCLLALVLVLTFLVAAIGCGDDDDDDAETATGTGTSTETASATGEPSESETPTATATTGTVTTGDAELDAVIAAVLAGDIDSLVERAQFLTLACSTATGVGGPPQCADGEAEGTEVQVFPFAACEGEYYREDGVPGLLEREIGEDPRIYAAFELLDLGTETFPRGDIGILFETPTAGSGDLGLIFGVDGEGNIVNLWRGCAAPAEQQFDSERDPAGEVFLEPQS
jgi:hypothetical protein